jgi:hypothetical protein
MLWGNRGAAKVRAYLVETSVELCQRSIHDHPDSTQGMICRYPLLRDR